MVVGVTLLSQRVVEMLAEAGMFHVVLVEPLEEEGSAPPEEDLQQGLFEAGDVSQPKAEVLIRHLNDSALYRPRDSVFKVTMKALPDNEVRSLTKVIGEVQPDLILLLSMPKLVVACNEACLLRKQPWICASANGYSWDMHLLCPGDTACMECKPPEQYAPIVEAKLNQGFSNSANTQCVASLVIETVMKCLNGGGPRFCSISLVNGMSFSRDMFPNPNCGSAKCQCLQDGLPIGA